MNLNIIEYHNQQIQQHQARHINSTQATVVLQTLVPDLTCTECYLLVKTSPRFKFSNFICWYQCIYPAITYSKQTQELFYRLLRAATATTARTITRDLVFSCQYQDDNYSSLEII